MDPMGVKICKGHSFYSFKVFTTKLSLQTPDGGSHKILFLEFEVWV